MQHPDREGVYELAHDITQQYASHHFQMCSIVNAKSGRCPQDCQWCAQSGRYPTQVDIFDVIEPEKAIALAKELETQQVERFSLVTSGMRPTETQFAKLLYIVKELKANTHIKICASMGLLSLAQLTQLKEAGVERYHCNLETAPSFFSQLVTTHTQADKIETIAAAKSLGMDLCCGGILGLGETIEQRIEFAFAVWAVGAKSIPLNILQAMPGTPLQHREPISSEEFLDAVALFRLVNPEAYLRFAGGRAQLPDDTIRKALHIGINSAITGNLLTTIGSSIEQDKNLIAQAGYTI